MAPEFVSGLRLSGKNDSNDAQAICAAVRQPQMRFVATKSAEQQSRLVVHRLRQGWQHDRTAAINRLRGRLAEFGRVYPNSATAALAGAREALADESLPAALRRGLARQLHALRELDDRLDECNREIAQRYLRGLLVQGARSALQAAQRAKPERRTRLAAWIVATFQRIGYHKTLVAIANKHARLVWVAADSR